MSERQALARAPILPGAWLGILGGGQLARMFCAAAQAMGYRVAVLDPAIDSPAGAVADRQLVAAYDDRDALAELAELCDAVSTEFENVPAASLELLGQTVPVSPAGRCVAVAQDRIAEKRFLARAGADVAPYLALECEAALEACAPDALAACLPGILKTARMGYDGKGQAVVSDASGLRRAFAAFGNVPCVLEKKLALDFEVSAIVARQAGGRAVVYPIGQNRHHHGILAATTVPAPGLAPERAAEVERVALLIAAELDYVGVLCVEFFVLADGRLIANEIAPRPHNSGHYTIDACDVSQFEQQVRAMTGLPLGSTRQHSSAVMLNVLGDSWFQGGSSRLAVTPQWQRIAAQPEAHLHLYGKSEPRIGRKMAHVTLTAAEPGAARAAALKSAALLGVPYD